MVSISRSQQTGAAGLFHEPTRVERAGREASFSDVLRSRLESDTGLRFSAHAMERMNARGIILSPDEAGRLAAAVERAGGKGSSDSLVILDRAAFIVSIANRTVVTALDRESMRETVFTNIDSAVVA